MEQDNRIIQLIYTFLFRSMQRQITNQEIISRKYNYLLKDQSDQQTIFNIEQSQVIRHQLNKQLNTQSYSFTQKHSIVNLNQQPVNLFSITIKSKQNFFKQAIIAYHPSCNMQRLSIDFIKKQKLFDLKGQILSQNTLINQLEAISQHKAHKVRQNNIFIHEIGQKVIFYETLKLFSRNTCLKSNRTQRANIMNEAILNYSRHFNCRDIQIKISQNTQFFVQLVANKLSGFRVIFKGNLIKIKPESQLTQSIVDLYHTTKSISEFQNQIIRCLKISQTSSQLKNPTITLNKEQLLGGGCGTSTSQVDNVQKKLQKERAKSLKTKLTNFKIDEQFMSEYREWLFDYEGIIKNMIPTKLRSPNSTTHVTKEVKQDEIVNLNDNKLEKGHKPKDVKDDSSQKKSSDNSLKEDQKDKDHDKKDKDHDKKDKDHDKKEKDHDKKNKDHEKKDKKDDKKEDKDEKKVEDEEDNDENDSDCECELEEEQTNLRAEIFQLEEFFYKYRKNLGDDISKYKPYYQDIFEMYLQFAFLSTNQTSCDTKDLIAAQKKKLGEMRVILESQMNKQPSLDLIFYLHIFEKIRDGNFNTNKMKMLNKLINQLKYIVSKTCSATTIVQSVFNGQLKTGIENAVSLYGQILSDIEVSESKNLFSLLFQISIERIQAVQTKTEKSILNFSNEVIFYIQKFNKIIEDHEDEKLEYLVIYFLIKINQLLEKLLLIKQQIKDEKDENLMKTKLEEFKDQTSILYTDILNKFIMFLIQEGEDASFFDTFKKLFKLQVGNYHLRFITLSVQLKIRKLFSMNQQEADPLFKLLTMNLFRRYLEETQDSVKILLYTDFYFQKFLKSGSKQKDSKLKEKLICDEQFIKEYLELDRTWKSRVLQINQGEEISYKIYQTFDAVYKKLKENSSVVNKILK